MDTYFQIRRATKLSRVFNTIAKRQEIPLSSFSFSFKGNHIEDYDVTAGQMELKDRDRIDCIVAYKGKCRQESKDDNDGSDSNRQT